MADKTKKAAAFEKLLEIARNGSLPLYSYENDYHKGGRNWPVEWEKELIYSHFRTENDRQHRLNRTLERLVEVNSPTSVEQVNKEKGLARLILDAGANPNFDSNLYSTRIFDEFLSQRKSYIALEIVKTDGFLGPQNTEDTFDILAGSLKYYMRYGTPMPGDTKEESAIIAQNCSDRRELVYCLFQKGLYPRDKNVFQSLVPIVLEQDPEFFNKRKQQVIQQITKAETPLQIYRVLMGQEKEKS